MKGNDILFSFIVSVYQIEDYIGQCIDSLISQCGKDSEIIIIDDGSTDKGGKIAEKYAEKHKCIHVIHQENRGLSAARNTGIYHAEGKYCIFVDGDDMLCEDALDSLRKCIENRQNPEIIIHRRKQIDPAGKSMECRYRFTEAALQSLSVSKLYTELQKMPDMYIGAWIFTVKTDYLRKNNFYFAEGLFHEDEEWVPKVLLNAGNIAFNNTCFYLYRIGRNGSITTTPNIERIFDKLKIINLLRKEFKQSKYTIDIKEVMSERIRSIYFGVICNAWQYRKDVKYDKLLKQIRKKNTLLRSSTRVNHKAGYLIIRHMGVRVACPCLWYANKIRKQMQTFLR